MPAALSYPGVYIQEVPSGVRTITGVATSITAFVGRAAAGPTDEPAMLTSYADYERRFGGLDVASPMSYMVRDFYLNGGALALVVRVAPKSAEAATITLAGGGGSPAEDLALVASSVGDWGNRLSAAVDHDTDLALPSSASHAVRDKRFNLRVRFQLRSGREDVEETFGSVSTDPAEPRFLPLVLERESSFVRVQGRMPEFRPAVTTIEETGSPVVAKRGPRRSRLRRPPSTMQRRVRAARSCDSTTTGTTSAASCACAAAMAANASS